MNEILRLETQLSFRDKQIKELIQKCTLLQLEEVFQTNVVKPLESTRSPVLLLELNNNIEEKTEPNNEKNENLDQSNKEKESDSLEKFIDNKESLSKKYYFMQPQTHEEIEANSTVINSLYQEIKRLIFVRLLFNKIFYRLYKILIILNFKELNEKNKEKEIEKKLKIERENILKKAKQDAETTRKELLELKAILFGVENFVDDNIEKSYIARNSGLEIELLELKVFFR